MAGNIKGVTIQFNGETTKLDKALRDIRKNTKDLDTELKGVDNALKFNPTNVDLWRQKQQILTQKVGETKEKLDVLKQAQAQMDSQGVDKTSAEYRDLQRQIIVTENQVKTFEGQLRSVGNVKLTALSEGFKEAGAKIEGAGQALSGVSMAAAGVVAGLGAISVKAGAAADDLNTLSKVTGIGTGDLQKYSYAADLVDVSVEDIAKANKKLAKNAYEAASGTGTQAEAFQKLGVNVLDSNGELKDSEVIFQEVIKGLGGVENETERAAIAQELMGKSAANLNPLIEDGGETYKMVADTLKKYDLDYVDQETLDKANEFNDSIDTMKLLGSVAFAQVGSQLAAYLAPALEKVVDLVGRFANWLGSLSPATLTVIAAIAGLVAAVAPVLIMVGKLATGIGAIIKLVGVIGPAISGFSLGPLAGVALAIGAVIAIGVLLYKNWDKIKETALAVGAKLKEIWQSVKESLSDAVIAIRTKLVGTWNNIKTTVSGVVKGLKDSIVGAWDTVKTSVSDAAKTIWDKLTWPFKKAKEYIEKIVNKIKDWFPLDIGKIFGDIKLPHFSWEWEDIGGIVSIPKIDIDWHKKGGIFDAPTIAGIGEAGPEAVVPLDKFWDKLDNIAAASSAPVINIYPGANQSAREIAKEVERVLVQEQKKRASAYGTI